jgi:hypothetical protein
MERISREDADHLKRILRDWQTPATMRCTLDAYRLRHGFYLAGQGAFQGWREAFEACRFADVLPAEEVRLGDDPPDFHLRTGDSAFACELVEVRNPQMRMGDEMDVLAALDASGSPLPIRAFNPTAEGAAAGEWLVGAITNKARKPVPYAENTVLAVSLQIHALASLAPEIEADVAAAVRTGAWPYGATWVLTSGATRLRHYPRPTPSGL